MLFLPALIGSAAVLIHILLDRNAPEFIISEYGLMLIPLVVIGLLTGPISEEFSWRGFAQPLLQVKDNPAAVSLIIGVI